MSFLSPLFSRRSLLEILKGPVGAAFQPRWKRDSRLESRSHKNVDSFLDNYLNLRQR